jgi:uncharacterized membrane protein
MNVLDKFVISHRVRNPLTYASVAGIVNILYGLTLASFLSWSNIRLQDMLPPVVTGALLGLHFYFYFNTLQNEDVSHFIGLTYVSPFFVALLSFLFLKEKISAAGYLGMTISLTGAILLSLRIKSLNLGKSAWMIVIMIFLSAGYEFFTKVATLNIPQYNGIAISNIALGVTILPVLLHKKTRASFAYELGNIKWTFISEALTLLAVLCLYFAMTGLKATVVSSIGAMQPLAVIVFERMAHAKFGKITQDVELLPKLGSILLIVIGIVVLYISDVL